MYIYKCAQSFYCQLFASEDLLRPACLLASLSLYGKDFSSSKKLTLKFYIKKGLPFRACDVLEAPPAYQKKGILFCVLQSA